MDFESRKKILEDAMEKVKSYPKELQGEALRFLLQAHNSEDNNSDDKRKRVSKGQKGNRKASAKVSGIGFQISKLIEEGFFKTPKSMKEISEKLAQKGFNVDMPYISPQLLKFVRNNGLKRHKDTEGRYVYYE